MVDAVTPVTGPAGRPRKRPHKLHADKGYDYPTCRKALRQRGIIARLARRVSSRRSGWAVTATSSNRSPGPLRPVDGSSPSSSAGHDSCGQYASSFTAQPHRIDLRDRAAPQQIFPDTRAQRCLLLRQRCRWVGDGDADGLVDAQQGVDLRTIPSQQH